MRKIINIKSSTIKEIPYKSAEQLNLKWTFVNIYSLRELKDVYLIVKDNQGATEKIICDQIHKQVKPENRPWLGSGKKIGRKALEPLTALKKFNLVDLENNVKKHVFNDSILNEELTENDKEELRQIFFDYFRFKELIEWFNKDSIAQNITNLPIIDKNYVQTQTNPIFFFPYQNRFNDTFFYELNDNTDLYILKEKENNSTALAMMRFWDVFLKWGTSLEVLEKFSFEYTDYRIQSNNENFKLKVFSCAYFISNLKEDIDVIEFGRRYFSTNRLYLPELVLQICLNFRIPVEKAKQMVVSQGLNHKDFIGFERTSEIFVKVKEFNKSKKETFFFPMFRNSFISHLNLK